MSKVTLTIGPQNYTIACADGEEAHIEALGGIIAGKYAQLGPARAPLEAQNMLFAALFMADELAEARRQLAAVKPDRVTALEHQVEQLKLVEKAAHEEISRLKNQLSKSENARGHNDLFGGTQKGEASEELAERLEQIADRAEAIASTLEAGTPSA